MGGIVTLDVKPALVFFRFLAAVTIVIVAVVHILGPTPRAFALEAVAVGHWLSHVWLVRTYRDRSIPNTMVALCIAQFMTAILFTLVEPWMLHLTPLICIAPVALATRWVDGPLYRRLTLAAITVIVGLAGILTVFDSGPIHDASHVWTRTAVAVLLTPTLAGFVGWIAWRNQRAMATHIGEIEQSRARLEQTGDLVRHQFEEASRAVLDRLNAARCTALADVEQSTGRLDAVKDDVQAIASELRLMAHRLGPAEFDLESDDDMRTLARECIASSESTFEILVEPLGERPPIVDVVARSILIELFAHGPHQQPERVVIRRVRDHIVVDIWSRDEPDAQLAPLTAGTIDRVEALEGWRTTELDRSGMQVALRAVPSRSGDDPGPNPRRSTLRSDLRLGCIFPTFVLAAGVVVWLTAIRDDEFLEILILVGMLYTLPCLVAAALAARLPAVSLLGFVAAHWITALVAADRLQVVKWFGPIALLIPLLLSLPYLRTATYTLLAGGTIIATAATIAIARIGSQIGAAADAPDFVAEAVVMTFVPTSSAIVLLLARRNHESIQRTANRLRHSRRQIVETADRARRSIERDLHDGTQQRLVSAALRLQIATRTPEPDERRRNTRLAADELSRAEQSVRDLSAAPGPSELVRAGLGPALQQLAGSSPVPVKVNVESLPEPLAAAVTTSVWFCCSEAVTNAIKHAGDNIEIMVDVRSTDDEIEFCVRDDGCGFSNADSDGEGLANIKERCTQHGGTAHIQSVAGQGTAIRGRIPVDHE